MKLTKEKIKKFEYMIDEELCRTSLIDLLEYWELDYEDYEEFWKLINEHFDNNMTTTWHNMVNEVDKLDRENSQLRYDLKFMEINFREAVDHANEFLEKTIALEKALDKACGELALMFDDFEDVKYTWSADEWKEYLLNGKDE